jgi:glycine dehydrogenase subunit 1
LSREADEKEMLIAIGVNTIDDLFNDIPEKIRTDLGHLQKGMSELEVRRWVEGILAKNQSTNDTPSFLGAGVYDFYVPAAVKAVAGRSEFLTSYTPYQPEVSQGLLQSLFEYQSMMSELTAMEVVNNSIYDHATALAEAVLMAARLSKGKVFLIPESLDLTRQCLLKNYAKGPGIEVKTYNYDGETGMADLDDLKAKLTDDVYAVYVGTPNLFGVFEESVGELRDIIDQRVLVAGVNALSLAVAKPPGEYDADIVVSEGQPFGNSINFGGPHLGILACKKKHVRKMPGRVIGMTTDVDGRRAFCMTLMTREQHIRREKATSNICTNEALTALATAAYMALQGGAGLRRLAVSVMDKARELAKHLNEIPGCTAPRFRGAHFNEFTLSLPIGGHEAVNRMLKKGVIAGMPLSDLTKGMENELLVAVTDKTTEKDMNALVTGLKEVLS